MKNSFGGQNGAGIGIRKTLAKVLQTVLRAFWRDSIFHFATCLTYFNKLLGIELGRKFVGLKADFTSVPMARLVTNSDSESVARFLKKTSRPKLTCRLEPNNSTMEQGFIYAVADELRNTL